MALSEVRSDRAAEARDHPPALSLTPARMPPVSAAARASKRYSAAAITPFALLVSRAAW